MLNGAEYGNIKSQYTDWMAKNKKKLIAPFVLPTYKQTTTYFILQKKLTHRRISSNISVFFSVSLFLSLILNNIRHPNYTAVVGVQYRTFSHSIAITINSSSSTVNINSTHLCGIRKADTICTIKRKTKYYMDIDHSPI